MVKIIAIDGPSASGKTQIAKKLSKKLNAPLLVSGKLYRAVALEIINKKINYILINNGKNYCYRWTICKW